MAGEHYPPNLYPHDADRTRQVVLRSWEPTAASAVGTIWEELEKGPQNNLEEIGSDC